MLSLQSSDWNPFSLNFRFLIAFLQFYAFLSHQKIVAMEKFFLKWTFSFIFVWLALLYIIYKRLSFTSFKITDFLLYCNASYIQLEFIVIWRFRDNYSLITRQMKINLKNQDKTLEFFTPQWRRTSSWAFKCQLVILCMNILAPIY